MIEINGEFIILRILDMIKPFALFLYYNKYIKKRIKYKENL